MESKEIIGIIRGFELRKVTIYVIGPYYVQHRGMQVNQAFDETDLIDNVYMDSISDVDCFTWSEPIESLEELQIEINS